ncbi:MAG: 3-phosphoshikimate 1-carboxyvinyltransferase [Candidatus Omnitrophota bacterium]
MSALVIKAVKHLKGEITLPGDKSISHRALLISALAEGESFLEGVQEGGDCCSTFQALIGFGVEIEKEGQRLLVKGKGAKGFQESDRVIDCGNSGTTMRLLSGIAAGLPYTTFLDGDASLRKRPMARIAEPLRQMGARVLGQKGDFPPLSIRGGSLSGIEYPMPVASAQVKSCLLLAGLFASGETVIIEPFQTRDHTERMLKYFGVSLKSKGNIISVKGGQRLSARQFKIPGDFSAAAFFLTAAVIVPRAELLIKRSGLNPTRTAFLQVLQEMGAGISIENQREESGEPVGDIIVRSGAPLKGVTVSGSLIPNLIDEIPLLAILGIFARGKTEIKDAKELRIKESDRIASLVTELRRMSVEIEEKEDGFVIFGPQKIKGARVYSHLDHRIAMSLAVAGLAAEGETVIEDSECIAISFPDFERTLLSLL